MIWCLVVLLSTSIIIGGDNIKQKDVKDSIDKSVEYKDKYDKKYLEAFDYSEILVDEVEYINHYKTVEHCNNQTQIVKCPKDGKDNDKKDKNKTSFTLIEHLNGTCTDQVEFCYNNQELDYIEEKVIKTKRVEKKVMKQKTKQKYDELKEKGYECIYPYCDKKCEVPLIDGVCTNYPDSNGDGICSEGESDCMEIKLE